MNIDVLGIDLGKNVRGVVGLDGKGKVVFRRRVRRITLAQLVEKLAPCVIGMEACCGAHHLGRQFAALGHTVRLMPPEYVKCYVKAHKNDDRDAEGIAEAATRPTMRYVTLKSEEQLDIQSLHRTRDRLVGERTALVNQLRAVLFERGLVILKGRTKLDRWLREELPNARGLSPRMQKLVSDMMLELREIDTQITAFDREFAELSRTDETMRSLLSIPGVGVINSTAIGAAIGDGSAFAKGRDFTAWLGLVPRQVTTGGKPRLVGITKRGSSYLRILLIHGARSALPVFGKERDSSRELASRIARTGETQRRCRRPGEQTGSDRMGRCAVGAHIRRPSGSRLTAKQMTTGMPPSCIPIARILRVA